MKLIRTIMILVLISLLSLTALAGCGGQDDAADGGEGYYALLWSSSGLEDRDSDPRSTLESVVVGETDGGLEISFVFGDGTEPPDPEHEGLEFSKTHLEHSTPDVYRLDVVLQGMEPSFAVLAENVTFEHPLLLSLRLDVYPESTVFTADFTDDVQVEFFTEDPLDRNALLMVIRDQS